MIFVKFNSIDRVENINLMKNSEYKKASLCASKWVITEKIDGSNFSLIIERNNPHFDIARRNDVLHEGEDMWTINAGKDRFNYVVECIREYMNDEWSEFDQINLFGEWFGKGIMKRVFYGDHYYYRFFNAVGVKGNIVVPLEFRELHRFIDRYHLNDHFVPILGYADSYEQAVQYKNDMPSTISPIGSIMEGIVIEPYDVRTHFKVKSKNELYSERKNHPQPVKIVGDGVEKLHQIFLQYITINRMYTIFSKNGYPVNGVNEASKYLRAFIKDAFDDFIKDNPQFEGVVEQRDRRYITNAGSEGFKLFSQALKDLAE